MTSHMFRISKKGNWTNDGDFIVHDFLGDIFFLKNVSRWNDWDPFSRPCYSKGGYSYLSDKSSTIQWITQLLFLVFIHCRARWIARISSFWITGYWTILREQCAIIYKQQKWRCVFSNKAFYCALLFLHQEYKLLFCWSVLINIGVNSRNPQPDKRLLKRQTETYRRKERK